MQPDDRVDARRPAVSIRGTPLERLVRWRPYRTQPCALDDIPPLPSPWRAGHHARRLCRPRGQRAGAGLRCDRGVELSSFVRSSLLTFERMESIVHAVWRRSHRQRNGNLPEGGPNRNAPRILTKIFPPGAEAWLRAEAALGEGSSVRRSARRAAVNYVHRSTAGYHGCAEVGFCGGRHWLIRGSGTGQNRWLAIGLVLIYVDRLSAAVTGGVPFGPGMDHTAHLVA
jgi:hypothetical protein